MTCDCVSPQLLGPGSAPPLRYMISLVELKSQAILRTIAAAEIAILPYSVLVLLTYVHGWGRGGDAWNEDEGGTGRCVGTLRS